MAVPSVVQTNDSYEEDDDYSIDEEQNSMTQTKKASTIAELMQQQK